MWVQANHIFPALGLDYFRGMPKIKKFVLVLNSLIFIFKIWVAFFKRIEEKFEFIQGVMIFKSSILFFFNFFQQS